MTPSMYSIGSHASIKCIQAACKYSNNHGNYTLEGQGKQQEMRSGFKWNQQSGWKQHETRSGFKDVSNVIKRGYSTSGRKHSSGDHADTSGRNRAYSTSGRKHTSGDHADTSGRKQDQGQEGRDYKHTLHFPKTTFPMRPKKEEKEWFRNKALRVYHDQEQREKVWVLHDGPPFANGKLHMGHALNKILKDTINRYKILNGYTVKYRPGWDCHGLPIEILAMKNYTKEKGNKDVMENAINIRSIAKQFATSTIDMQREEFKDWFIMGEWENPYLSMDPEYEAQQLSVFAEMLDKGLIFRGERPVFWSPSTHTALAEAELEYQDDHVSPSVFVRFPIKDSDSYALIWTTTPWTLLANEAICINENVSYCFVTFKRDTSESCETYLIARDLLDKLHKKVFKDHEIVSVQDISSEEVLKLKATHPLHQLNEIRDSSRPFVAGSHVTTEQGTGLVHTAPGHGHDDWIVGKQFNLPVTSSVNEYGKFIDNPSIIPSEFINLVAMTKGNDLMVDYLSKSGHLLLHEPYKHRYPYDWRSKKPILIRSTKQWFAELSQLKQDAEKVVENIKFYPENGKGRLISAVTGRNEWCISRQRVWGVPIPIFFKKNNPNEYLATKESLEYVISLVRKHGTDCWWEFSTEELLPPSMKHEADEWVRSTDTLDVWFDSGTSWKSVLDRADELQQSDLYLEGSDQHRGWFQSSLLTSLAMGNKSPYKQLLTHGFVLDENGRKMSKSIGNVIAPSDYTVKKQLNPDILRLWAVTGDFTKDMLIGNKVMDIKIHLYRKFRNTAKFMLGLLNDYEPPTEAPEISELTDRMALHDLYVVGKKVDEGFESFNFRDAMKHLEEFSFEISKGYLDIIKDRLYAEKLDDPKRKQSQYVIYQLLSFFTRAIAPVMPYLSEEIYKHYPALHAEKKSSIYYTEWYSVNPQWQLSANELQEVENLWKLRQEILYLVEQLRQKKEIGSSLESEIHIQAKEWPFSMPIEEFTRFCIVSQLRVGENIDNFPLNKESNALVGTISARRVQDFHKCIRCWKFDAPSENHICPRCEQVLREN